MTKGHNKGQNVKNQEQKGGEGHLKKSQRAPEDSGGRNKEKNQSENKKANNV
jgi:hypothetical protein